MNWSDFNAAIVTRCGTDVLYDKNVKNLLNRIPYPKVPLRNTTADGYLMTILEKLDYDWIINIDDDAFLFDPSALYELLVYMRDNQYAYCGTPDALTYSPRPAFNPASMNPFFNIFNRRLIDVAAVKRNGTYSESLVANLDLSQFHPEIVGMDHSNVHKYKFPIHFEPFYPIFHGLLHSNAKPLLLYSRAHKDNVGIVLKEDNLTTALYLPRELGGREFLYHTWYSRDYIMKPGQEAPPNNRQRIDNALAKAISKIQ